MKRSILVFSMTSLLLLGGMNMVFAQEQPQPKKDTVNMDTDAKPTSDLYEILSGQARTSQLYGIPLIDIMPELMPEWEKKLKRISDVTISLIILVLTLPLNILVALAIRLDSKGPVLFKQERIGMNNKNFKIHFERKFNIFIQ